MSEIASYEIASYGQSGGG